MALPGNWKLVCGFVQLKMPVPKTPFASPCRCLSVRWPAPRSPFLRPLFVRPLPRRSPFPFLPSAATALATSFSLGLLLTRRV